MGDDQGPEFAALRFHVAREINGRRVVREMTADDVFVMILSGIFCAIVFFTIFILPCIIFFPVFMLFVIVNFWISLFFLVKNTIQRLSSSTISMLYPQLKSMAGFGFSSFIFCSVLFMDVSSDLIFLILDQIEAYFVRRNARRMEELTEENGDLRRRQEQTESKYRRLLILVSK
ncbi:hypothetical protein PFISCL1PPCAC_9318, partial [Pristionchus fissidentatus]